MCLCTASHCTLETLAEVTASKSYFEEMLNVKGVQRSIYRLLKYPCGIEILFILDTVKPGLVHCKGAASWPSGVRTCVGWIFRWRLVCHVSSTHGLKRWPGKGTRREWGTHQPPLHCSVIQSTKSGYFQCVSHLPPTPFILQGREFEEQPW